MNMKRALLSAGNFRRLSVKAIILPLLLALSVMVAAQTPAVTLAPAIHAVAGNYTLGPGYSGDNGAATSASLTLPQGVALDGSGNLYIADTQNNAIRKVNATTQIITTVAGNGTYGYSGDTGPATQATLANPTGVAVDAAGDLYIADVGNAVIRRVDAITGYITTVAGGGSPASGNGDGGQASLAILNVPIGVGLDSAGDLFIADAGDNVIRLVTFSTQVITTVAGGGTFSGTIGDGGLAINAVLQSPSGVAIDSAGDIFIADTGHNVVRVVNASTHVINTVAGSFSLGAGFGGDGSLATSAQLTQPSGLVVDAAGNLYICDQGNNVVRLVSAQTKNISTFAGENSLGAGYSGEFGPAAQSQLRGPFGLAQDSAGDLYIADTGNSVVRVVQAVTGSTMFSPVAVGGSGSPDRVLLQLNSAQSISSITATASQASAAEFTVGTVSGCVVDGSTVNALGSFCVVPVTFSPAYTGRRNVALKVVTSAGTFAFGLSGVGTGAQVVLIPGTISSIAGTAPEVSTATRDLRALKHPAKSAIRASRGSAHSAAATNTISTALDFPNAVAVDNAGNVYIADTYHYVVRKLTASGTLTIVAGNGTSGYSGDGAVATSAELLGPEDVALDGAGNLYIADQVAIRRVDAVTGSISTVAGGGTPSSGNGDGGPATSAELNGAFGLAVDTAGNIYIADYYNGLIRKVSASTGYINTIVGAGTNGYTVNGVPASSASLGSPYGVSVDAGNNLYISDLGDQVVRKVVASTGLIYTIAGDGTGGYSGDGGLATSAELNDNGHTTVDGAGNLYIADFGNSVIRKVDAGTGVINSIAGTSSSGYNGDGVAATSAALNGPDGVAVDGEGNLYIADSGNNLVREVTASAATLTFPSQTLVSTLDTTDGAITVTVSNIGNQSLNILQTTISQVQNSSTCSSPLASGGSCTESVEFYPTTAGSPLSGYVTLQDNALNAAAPNYTTQTIPVQGTAVAQYTQTITFPNPGTQIDGVAPITLTATASSGLAVSYSVTSGPATVSGSVLTITGAGTVVVKASQAGNTDYAAATAVSDSFLVVMPTYTLTAASTAITISDSSSGTINLSLASSNYAGTVNLAVTTTSSAISGSAPAVTLTSNGTGSSVLTITTTASASNKRPARPWKSGGALLFCAVLVGLPFGVRRRRALSILLVALVICMAGVMMSCSGGGGGGSSTPASRTYTVTVTPTGGTTPLTNPSAVSIIVTVP